MTTTNFMVRYSTFAVNCNKLPESLRWIFQVKVEVSDIILVADHPMYPHDQAWYHVGTSKPKNPPQLRLQ